MLNTVEEIEDEILKLLIAHDDDLESSHDRMEFITEQGKVKLDEYEKILDKHYAEYDEEEYKEAYLVAYKEAKQKVLDAVKNSLDKEAEGMLKKIQESPAV